MTNNSAAPKCLICGHKLNLYVDCDGSRHRYCQAVDCILARVKIPERAIEALSAKLGRQEKIGTAELYDAAVAEWESATSMQWSTDGMSAAVDAVRNLLEK